MTQNKNYCFTSFNLSLDWEHLNIEQLDTKQSIKYIIYQGEYTKDNKQHIQGFIQFHTKKRIDYIKKLFNDNTLHLEPMKGTPQQASDYCKKTDKDGTPQEIFFNYREYGTLDTTTSGTRKDLLELRDRIQQGETINKIMLTTDDNKTLHNCIQYNRTLREFQHQVHQSIHRHAIIEQYANVIWNNKQQMIIDIINEETETTNTRRVNWIYDKIGNIGKTHLAKYYIAQGNTYYITGGKQADILYAYEGQDIIIYDLARTYSDNLDHIYTTIENFKNGCYLSTKYNTEQRVYKHQPIIIVLANFKPDTTKLSTDRWNVIDTDHYDNNRVPDANTDIDIDNDNDISVAPPIMIPKKRIQKATIFQQSDNEIINNTTSNAIAYITHMRNKYNNDKNITDINFNFKETE